MKKYILFLFLLSSLGATAQGTMIPTKGGIVSIDTATFSIEPGRIFSFFADSSWADNTLRITVPGYRIYTDAGNVDTLDITAGEFGSTVVFRLKYGLLHYKENTVGTSEVRNQIIQFLDDVPNSGTSETDIYTYTTPAGFLSKTGDRLMARYTLSLTDNTSTATIKAYFAGTQLFTSNAVTVITTGTAVVDVTVIRTGTTTAKATVTLVTESNTKTAYTSETDLTSLNFATTNIVKVTGQAGGVGGGSSDIVGKMGFLDRKTVTP